MNQIMQAKLEKSSCPVIFKAYFSKTQHKKKTFSEGNNGKK